MIVLMLLVQLMGTDGQIVWVNPSQVVSIREPRRMNTEHWPRGTKCLVLTTDQKFFTTSEPCEQVRLKLGVKHGGG